MKILVIGGDKRQYYMAKFLSSKGFAVSYFGEMFFGDAAIREIRGVDKLFTELDQGKAETIVLPIPAGNDYVRGCMGLLKARELAKHMKKVKRVYGGVIPAWIVGLQSDMEIIDFMQDESVVLRNAAITAENAIVEAMIMSDSCICGSKCMVIGYGRCGQMLADRLRAMKGDVTVAELKDDRAGLAKSYGYLVEEITSLAEYDFIFQTAPGFSLDPKILLTSVSGDKNPIILDISSSSMLDLEYGEQIGVEIKRCQGLPGRYTPKSAGILLGEYILEKEKRDGIKG